MCLGGGRGCSMQKQEGLLALVRVELEALYNKQAPY